MSNPFTLPPRSPRREILDLRPATPAEIEANFNQIALVNRTLGGVRAVRVALSDLLRENDDQEVHLLDVATGGADIPRALIAFARRGGFGDDRRRRLHITATDLSREVLDYAHHHTPTERFPEIEIAAADALHLPYPDDSFDYATCSMALHHFDPPRAVELMREMARVSRRGVIVNDLRRSRVAAGLIWLLTRLLRAHPITQHDAPLSVLRAYTPAEVADLFARADVGGTLTIRRAPMYRLVAVLRKNAARTSQRAG